MEEKNSEFNFDVDKTTKRLNKVMISYLGTSFLLILLMVVFLIVPFAANLPQAAQSAFVFIEIMLGIFTCVFGFLYVRFKNTVKEYLAASTRPVIVKNFDITRVKIKKIAKSKYVYILFSAYLFYRVNGLEKQLIYYFSREISDKKTKSITNDLLGNHDLLLFEDSQIIASIKEIEKFY